LITLFENGVITNYPCLTEGDVHALIDLLEQVDYDGLRGEVYKAILERLRRTVGK